MHPETILVGSAEDPGVSSSPLEPSIIVNSSDGEYNRAGTVADEKDNFLMRSLVVSYREDHFELRRYKEVLKTIHPTLSLLCRSASFRNSSLNDSLLKEAPLQEKCMNGSPTLDPSNSQARQELLEANHSTMLTSPLSDLNASMVEDLPDLVASNRMKSRGGKSRSSVFTAFAIHNVAQDRDDENVTPRYPLLHGKNLATFSPEELNYRWQCELCGIEGLRSREYWSHCLEDEHRRRALAVATIATSTTAVNSEFGGDVSNKATSTVAFLTIKDDDSHGSGCFEAGNPLPVLPASEDDDDTTEGSVAEQWRMIDPLNELDTIDNDPSNDDAIEWNPPANDQSLWDASIRSILEETPSRRKRRYSADVWGSILSNVEEEHDVAKPQHARRRSCPDVLSPMTTQNNVSATFSMGSPSFNLGIVVGELESSIRQTAEEDETESVGPLALLSKLAFF